jgi:hypothetical protein
MKVKLDKLQMFWQISNMWYSSYEQNNYGELFYSLIRIYKPEKVVELGTRAGYSAYHIARGLEANGQGTLDCYDLWGKNYGSDSVTRSLAEKNIEKFKTRIKLHQQDALDVSKSYKEVDILHVDLDNDGDILEQIIPNWIDKTRQMIIIEGGSVERDKLAGETMAHKVPLKKWMADIDIQLPQSVDSPDQFVVVSGKEEYQEKPIAPWLKSFSKKRGDIEYITLDPFPSLTIMSKRQ